MRWRAARRPARGEWRLPTSARCGWAHGGAANRFSYRIPSDIVRQSSDRLLAAWLGEVQGALNAAGTGRAAVPAAVDAAVRRGHTVLEEVNAKT